MMKKYVLFLAAILLLAACSADDQAKNEENKTSETAVQNEASKEKKDSDQTEQTNKETKNEESSAIVHHEPDEETKCAFCQMKVYTKEEEMGPFTAKAITTDDETLFFDDAGCLLNYAREHGEETLAHKHVRDYETLEWIDTKEALAIQDENLQTPMKYSNAFFKDEESLNEFKMQYPNATVVTMKEIDAEANERYMKKKKINGEEHEEHGGH